MLIINDKIRELMKGYPTVSDKYNVAGGVLMGADPVQFGGLVKFATQNGYFMAIDATQTIASVAEIAGFVLATNVKLATEWPGKTVEVLPGEAFNLLINGFMAVELGSGAKVADIKPNAAVYVTAAGAITTSTDTGKLGSSPIPNVVFTGVYENIGTTDSPKYLAEILVK